MINNESLSTTTTVNSPAQNNGDILEFNLTLADFERGLQATQRHLIRSAPHRHLMLANISQFVLVGIFVTLLVTQSFQAMDSSLKITLVVGLIAMLSFSSFQWMLQRQMHANTIDQLTPHCGRYRLALRDGKLLIQAPGYKLQIDKNLRPMHWQDDNAHYLLLGLHLVVIPQQSHPTAQRWLSHLVEWVKE